MEISRYTIDIDHMNSFVDSQLLSCVFHVTLLTNLRAILETKGVNAAGGGEKTFGFGSNGFFRNRECVSVFDLREPEHKEFNFSLMKCHPLQPVINKGRSVAVLFLMDSEYPRLLSWCHWKKEQAWSQMIVPYVEAGFPSPLCLNYISRIVIVRPSKKLKSWPKVKISPSG